MTPKCGFQDKILKNKVSHGEQWNQVYFTDKKYTININKRYSKLS